MPCACKCVCICAVQHAYQCKCALCIVYSISASAWQPPAHQMHTTIPMSAWILTSSTAGDTLPSCIGVPPCQLHHRAAASPPGHRSQKPSHNLSSQTAGPPHFSELSPSRAPVYQRIAGGCVTINMQVRGRQSTALGSQRLKCQSTIPATHRANGLHWQQLPQ